MSKDFIRLCFTSDPELRPTVSDLLSHPFVNIDPHAFDYKEWYSAASDAAALAAEMESGDESSDYSDEYYDPEDQGQEVAEGDGELSNTDLIEGYGLNTDTLTGDEEENEDEGDKSHSILQQ